LPWLERFEPSMTKSPELAKPQRASSASMRALRVASSSGENLLNSGAIQVG
jgi:hypothetical protein